MKILVFARPRPSSTCTSPCSPPASSSMSSAIDLTESNELWRAWQQITARIAVLIRRRPPLARLLVRDLEVLLSHLGWVLVATTIFMEG